MLLFYINFILRGVKAERQGNFVVAMRTQLNVKKVDLFGDALGIDAIFGKEIRLLHFETWKDSFASLQWKCKEIVGHQKKFGLQFGHPFFSTVEVEEVFRSLAQMFGFVTFTGKPTPQIFVVKTDSLQQWMLSVLDKFPPYKPNFGLPWRKFLTRSEEFPTLESSSREKERVKDHILAMVGEVFRTKEGVHITLVDFRALVKKFPDACCFF